MRLHEAIEKAGEGGKIRRGLWEHEDVIHIELGSLRVDAGLSGFNLNVASNLTATDWEVVEDEVIEVGDVVQGFMENGTVIHRGDFSTNGERVIILDKQGAFWIDKVSNCALIFKSPKAHTFKGVRWEQKYGGYPVPTGRDMVEARNLIDNGKTYTITATEERVEPELDGRN